MPPILRATLFLFCTIIFSYSSFASPTLYFQEGDHRVQVVGIDDGVFYVDRGGELIPLTHVGDSGIFVLEDLPDDLLTKVHVPPHVELLTGPRGRPQDSKLLQIRNHFHERRGWISAIAKSVDDASRYLLVNAWYLGQSELVFYPYSLSSASRDYFFPVRELPASDGSERAGVPIVFAFNPDQGILDCSGQFGESQTLATALLLNQPDEVNRLILSGANPNLLGEEGWAPVHLAATLFNEAAHELLKSRVSNVNLRDICNWTPLHHASTRGNLAAARLLFDRGIRANLLSDSYETALIPAIRSADAEYVEFLLKRRKGTFLSEGRNPGTEVMNNYRDDLVHLLVRERAVPAPNRDTAHLFLAQLIRDDRVELVRMQLERQGLSVRREVGGDWPIVLAARDSSVEMLELLHQNGAGLDVVDSKGLNALHIAARSNAGIIPWLIRKGVDPNSFTNNGWTPLGIALMAMNVNSVLALLEGGADPNIEVGDGHHLLWLATRLAQRQTVSHLVEAGAICEFTPDSAKKLLEDAFRYDIPEVFDITLAQCIDVDFEFAGGFPGWGVAERYGAHRIQSLMLDRGLRENSQNDLKLVSHQEVSRFEPVQIIVPPYPDELALKYGPQRVLVNVVIGSDGVPRFPLIIDNPIPELRDEIIDYIRHWLFRIEGIPEGVHGVSVTLPLPFEVEEKVFELNELTKSPKPLSQTAPEYPAMLHRRGIQGSVILLFVIAFDGTVPEDRIQIQRTAHPEFSRAAIDAVRTWKFEPGERNGEPVSCWVRIEIPFSVRM